MRQKKQNGYTIEQQCDIMDRLYSYKFHRYKGEISNREKLANYINSLKCGTRFTHYQMARGSGLTTKQVTNAKRHWVIRDALKMMQIDPDNVYKGYERF
ncbi:MAG: hypothetical protein LUD84_06485 [Clostridiales bacterium]|nr:hypothetical protein [Clostridiales bacterium]